MFYRCSYDTELYVKKTHLFQKLVAAAVMTREVSKLIMEHFTGICQFAGRHFVGKQPHPVIGHEVTDVSQHLQCTQPGPFFFSSQVREEYVLTCSSLRYTHPLLTPRHVTGKPQSLNASDDVSRTHAA